MPILYYLGASDVYRIEEPRPVGFHRADDEPHPYAHVDQEAASAILAAYPDLFKLKDAPKAQQGVKNHIHNFGPGPEAPPLVDAAEQAAIDAAIAQAKKKPGRKPKAQ